MNGADSRSHYLDFGTKVTEIKVDPSLLKKTPAEVERHVMQAINQGLTKVSSPIT